MRRFPYILWFYVLADLWKLVLLTTAVLATVIAFAAAVKPLADGKLGPEDTLKFMALAMVPMLQYALPFAACFGATLAYHRLATDNELSAVHAGGISHRAMLVPALVSGLLLGALLLALSNSIIPRFLRGMSELVAQDAAKVIKNSVDRGEALRMGDTLIYADRAERLGPDPASDAYERLWLAGLLVVRTDDKDHIVNQGTASTAKVWLRRTTAGASRDGSGDAPGASIKPMTEVIIQPTDSVGLGPTMRAATSEAVFRMLMPNAFGDNVKFLSFSELRELRQHPDKIDRVDKAKRTLAMVLAERQMIDAIDQALRVQGEAHFLDGYKQPVTLRASGVRSTRKKDRSRESSVFQIKPQARAGDRGIVVEITLPDKKTVRHFAESGFLRLPSSPDIDHGSATVSFQLFKVAARQAGSDGEVEAPDPDEPDPHGELAERPMADLTFVGDLAPEMLLRSVREVDDMARQRVLVKPSDAAVIDPALRQMRSKVEELLREVLSKEHERYAMSVACLVMVLVGAVMAMRLREALPLTVYLWAFFPALATVLAISGGQQLTHAKGLGGLPVLWAGVAALGAFALAEFVRLIKH